MLWTTAGTPEPSHSLRSRLTRSGRGEPEARGRRRRRLAAARRTKRRRGRQRQGPGSSSGSAQSDRGCRSRSALASTTASRPATAIHASRAWRATWVGTVRGSWGAGIGPEMKWGSTGVDPLSWTPEEWGPRSPGRESTCTRPDPHTRPSFGAEAIRLVREGGAPSGVARILGCTRDAIRNWLKQADARRGRPQRRADHDEREELARLRRPRTASCGGARSWKKPRPSSPRRPTAIR